MTLVSKLTLSMGLCFLPSFVMAAAQGTSDDKADRTAQVAQQQSWTGTLVDAKCKASDASGKCEVSESTTTFGIQTADGTFYRFDTEGNSKATAALQKATVKSGAITASVSGSLDGSSIKVQSIQLH